ncbi:CGNR zinc finger domain-containing protein [Streptomyces sp. SBT349]|uniref:CGNR zinc finger domain-containing protein n=1 Tax=Streptomyces sp. SBT349 TaxID=1580539 RepID=UPI00066EA8E7|nr:CGNR zinc finger domain-containing protein [Streptomyces sp. SBT349]
MAARTTPSGLALVEDFVNTVDLEGGGDSLADPDGLAAFAERAGTALTGADLPEVLRLREALREACVAHTGPAPRPDRAAELNEAFAAAPLTLEIDPLTGAATLVPAAGLRGAAALAARVAAVVAEAEARGTWQRLKACEADSCRWAYYDHSPAGRRRWCSMQVCGARAKMRSYRAKRRRA